MAEGEHPELAAKGPGQLVDVGVVERRFEHGALARRHDPVLGSPRAIGGGPGTIGCGLDAQPFKLLRERRVGFRERLLGRSCAEVPAARGLVSGNGGRVATRGCPEPGACGLGPRGVRDLPACPRRVAREARVVLLSRGLGIVRRAAEPRVRLLEVRHQLVADRVGLVALRRGLVGVGGRLVGVGRALVRLHRGPLGFERQPTRGALDPALLGAPRIPAVHGMPPGRRVS